MSKASSGFSADTTMVDVAVTRGGIANEERYVLRTESPDPPVYPVQVPGWQVEIELQYRDHGRARARTPTCRSRR